MSFLDNSRTLGVVCFVLTCMYTLFLILSVSLPEWYTGNGSRVGIWKGCVDVIGSVCIDYKWSIIEDWLKAVQALSIVSIIMSVMAGWFQVLAMRRTLRYAIEIALSSLAASVTLLVTFMSIYMGNSHSSYVDSGASWGASFYLAIITGVFGFVDFVMTVHYRTALRKEDMDHV